MDRAELAADTADLLTALSRRLGRRARGALAPDGITGSQMRALRAVARDDGIRMGALAEALGVVPRSATSLVDELEQHGLLARRADPSDGRSKIVTLTADGRALRDRLRSARLEHAAELFSALPTGDLAALRDLLQRLAADPGSAPPTS